MEFRYHSSFDRPCHSVGRNLWCRRWSLPLKGAAPPQAAAAASLTTVVVQETLLRSFWGVLASPQFLDPLALPDVQAAKAELRVQYEVEKA